jgi:hypothetical protein
MERADAAGRLRRSPLFVRRVRVLIEYLGGCFPRFLGRFSGPDPLGAGVGILALHWRDVRVHFPLRIDRLPLVFDVYLSSALRGRFDPLSFFCFLVLGHMFHLCVSWCHIVPDRTPS